MSERDEALTLAENVLKAASGADQAQVTVTLTDAAYARFGQNFVTQNLESRQTVIELAYYSGKRVGRVSSGDVSSGAIERLVASAATIAGRVPPDNGFVSLPKPEAIPAGVKSYYASTADAGPDERVEKLLPVFARMKRSNLTTAGYTTTQVQTVAIANSLGVRAAYTGTTGGIEIKAMAPQTSGYAAFYTPDYAALESAPLADHAATKATVAAVPADLTAGVYTVVMEPNAFQSALKALIEGLGAQSVLEDKESWMVDVLGQAIFSPNFTLRDDWSNPLLANAPFARDGSPADRPTLIERGVPKTYLAGTYAANKYKVKRVNGTQSYVVDPGTKSRDELIASVERGVLISRTWYDRVVDPRRAAITGITRDGVYLIENGKLTKTLKNFRYFVSMVDVMKDVEFSNTALRTAPELDLGVSLVVPDAKFARFNLAVQTSYA
ncbi:MAG TPA: TldD/PmbA family protein [Candidatus Baltobacteraceae bacterium]|nr:TldD/PmbA family protein [Candidatus Baltobacteraceae bacterium]